MTEPRHSRVSAYVDRASPSAVARRLAELLTDLPSGWSLTNLRMETNAEGDTSFVMLSEPVLAEQMAEARRCMWKAREAADAALADADRAANDFATAEQRLAAHLDDARPPSDGGARSLPVGPYELSRQT